MATTPPQEHGSQDLVSLSQEDSKVVTSHQFIPLGSSLSIELPEAPPPTGKLYIHIVEARDLRPSPIPYVLCSFEGNEELCKLDSPEVHDSDYKDGFFSDGGSEVQERTIKNVTEVKWDQKVVFDVFGSHSKVDVTVYDCSDDERFLGRVRLDPSIQLQDPEWFKLERRESTEETVSGVIRLALHYEQVGMRQYGPEDFRTLNFLGLGKYAQVHQVREKDTTRLYAMKVLSKKDLQVSGQAHTIRPPATGPFIAEVKFIFQTFTNIYVVADYKHGGELFFYLQKEGRFPEERAKFYIAELVLALEFLHKQNYALSDLRPGNILLDGHGHISLSDFGISREYLQQGETFRETAEYRAPETLLLDEYAASVADFWSLGVLIFEMCCGWSPVCAEDPMQMRKNIAFGKVRFPRDALSANGRNFVKGLMKRNPKLRLGSTNGARDLKEHPFFHDTDWTALLKYECIPPFKPKLKPQLCERHHPDLESTSGLLGPSFNARGAALASAHVGAFVEESNIHANFGRAGSSDGEGDVEERDEQAGKTKDRRHRGEDDWLSGDLELNSDSEHETLHEVTDTMENFMVLTSKMPPLSMPIDWTSFAGNSVPKWTAGGSAPSQDESILSQKPLLDPFSKRQTTTLTDTATKFKGFGLLDDHLVVKGFGSPQTPGSAGFGSPSSYATAWSRLGSAPLHSVISPRFESLSKSTSIGIKQLDGSILDQSVWT